MSISASPFEVTSYTTICQRAACGAVRRTGNDILLKIVTYYGPIKNASPRSLRPPIKQRVPSLVCTIAEPSNNAGRDRKSKHPPQLEEQISNCRVPNTLDHASITPTSYPSTKLPSPLAMLIRSKQPTIRHPPSLSSTPPSHSQAATPA